MSMLCRVRLFTIYVTPTTTQTGLDYILQDRARPRVWCRPMSQPFAIKSAGWGKNQLLAGSAATKTVMAAWLVKLAARLMMAEQWSQQIFLIGIYHSSKITHRHNSANSNENTYNLKKLTSNNKVQSLYLVHCSFRVFRPNVLLFCGVTVFSHNTEISRLSHSFAIRGGWWLRKKTRGSWLTKKRWHLA